jgi:hypothetical protein
MQILAGGGAGAAEFSVEYLVIAGGGGGGEGGGGAGGYRTSVSGATSGRGSSAESPLTILEGASVTVTIGAAANDSVFSTITSIKGGNG